MTSKTIEPTWKKKLIKNDIAKEFHKVEIFDKDNKLIDGDIMSLGDLVSIKCYTRYWRHFVSKRHGLTLDLIAVKNYYIKQTWSKTIMILVDLSYESNKL